MGLRDRIEKTQKAVKEWFYKIISEIDLLKLIEVSEKPDIVMMSGLPKLDESLRWQLGRMYLITAYPNHGKTELMSNLMVLLGMNHQKKILIYCPENYPIEYYQQTLIHIFIGKPFKECTESELQKAKQFLEKHIHLLTFKETPDFEELYKAWDAKKKDYDCFVIDPFNSLNDTNENIAEALKAKYTKMKHFAQHNDKIVVIVEHPRSPKKSKDNKVEFPTVFDLYGGSMGNNKNDVIIILGRVGLLDKNPDYHHSEVWIDVAKIKDQRIMGRPGRYSLHYNIKTGRYQNNTPI